MLIIYVDPCWFTIIRLNYCIIIIISGIWYGDKITYNSLKNAIKQIVLVSSNYSKNSSLSDYTDNGEYRCIGKNKVFGTHKTDSSKTLVEVSSDVTVQLTDTG